MASSPARDQTPNVDSLREALEDGGKVLLACDPSLEGVLCAVGMAYLAHAKPDAVHLCRRDTCQPALGERVVEAPPCTQEASVALARRVWAGYLSSIGARPNEEFASRLTYAAASDSPQMPEVVHRYLRLCFGVGQRVRHMPSDPVVVAHDDLARHVHVECEHTRQFVRFSHLADGSFAAAFRPNANTVPLTCQHFCRRMGTERFYLVDPRHRVVALHEAGARKCQVVGLDSALAAELADVGELADDERYVRAMWKRLYDALTLEGRGPAERGYDLRTSWMPQRFWDGLTELDPRSDDPGAQVPRRYQG